MPKANPKAYFPNSFTARISYKKVDKHAQAWRQHSPYFDTWTEARDYMLMEAEQRLKRAQKDLAWAISAYTKASNLKEPSNG